MSQIARIVLGLVKLALVVDLTGGLIDLTRTMKDEAAKAHRQGLVSLKQLNSSLAGRGESHSRVPVDAQSQMSWGVWQSIAVPDRLSGQLNWCIHDLVEVR